MERATQTLHRLTSYELGREWTEPADVPRVLQDLEVNDVDRLPWFFKRYAQPLPRVALPRDLPPTTVPAVGRGDDALPGARGDCVSGTHRIAPHALSGRGKNCALVGADGVHEWPVAAVALERGTPALDATGSAVAGPEVRPAHRPRSAP